MSTSVDHVVICVPNLDQAVDRFEEEHGVVSVSGGRHRGHGTANRLVPLGDTYIELVAVVDPHEASDSVFGKWVATSAGSLSAHTVAFRTDDLDSICDRLGLEPVPMSRQTDSGDELRWRLAGLEHTVTSGLPFFIQWDMGSDLHPGRIPVKHPAGAVSLGVVTISGDIESLGLWANGIEGVTLREGEPQVDFELISG